jgi:hypothetical protein
MNELPHGLFSAHGDNNDPPPEPGFARREAHCAGLKRDHLGRLLKPLSHATALKEGARGEPGVPPR